MKVEMQFLPYFFLLWQKSKNIHAPYESWNAVFLASLLLRGNYFFSASAKKVRMKLILVFLFVIATKNACSTTGGKEKSLAKMPKQFKKKHLNNKKR